MLEKFYVCLNVCVERVFKHQHCPRVENISHDTTVPHIYCENVDRLIDNEDIC